jgi:hypothetical protein
MLGAQVQCFQSLVPSHVAEHGSWPLLTPHGTSVAKETAHEKCYRDRLDATSPVSGDDAYISCALLV